MRATRKIYKGEKRKLQTKRQKRKKSSKRGKKTLKKNHRRGGAASEFISNLKYESFPFQKYWKKGETLTDDKLTIFSGDRAHDLVERGAELENSLLRLRHQWELKDQQRREASEKAAEAAAASASGMTSSSAARG